VEKVDSPEPRIMRFRRALTEEDDIYGSALEVDPIRICFNRNSCFVRFRPHTVLSLALLASHFKIHVVSRAPQPYVRAVTGLLEKNGISIRIIQYDATETAVGLKSVDIEASFILDNKIELWYPYRRLRPDLKLVRVDPARVSGQDTLLSMACFCVFEAQRSSQFVSCLSPLRLEKVSKRPLPETLVERRARSLLYNLPYACAAHVFRYLCYETILAILDTAHSLPQYLLRYLRVPPSILAPFCCEDCNSFFHRYVSDCPGCADVLNGDSWDVPTEPPKLLSKRKASTHIHFGLC